jgi:hypothetical protein
MTAELAMTFTHLSTKRMATALSLLFTSLAAHATNGINLIGFGAESSLMAGADVAVARDTSALNTNPAGLTLRRANKNASDSSLFTSRHWPRPTTTQGAIEVY